MRFRDVSYSGGTACFSVDIHDRVTGDMETLEDLILPMPGEHNVSNAVAAIAVAHALGVDGEAIAKGLAGFAGVKRRFTRVGSWNGVEIYDDYGHHPVEIAAVLKAAREALDGDRTPGRVIAVVQPHRFTRLRDLFEDFCTCFNEADMVIVADVYPAGETPIEGVDKEHLVEGLRSGGHRDARRLMAEGDLPAMIAGLAEPGDMLVFLGAGSITKWAHELPDALAALDRT